MMQDIFEDAQATPFALEDSEITPQSISEPLKGEVREVVSEVTQLAAPTPKNRRKFNSSLWTVEENKKYLEFLNEHRQIYESSEKVRWASKINKTLSSYVTTRKPSQCRSHHQKMLIRHRDIDGIIEHLHQVLEMAKGHSEQERAQKAIRIRRKAHEVHVKTETTPKIEENDLFDVLVGFETFNEVDEFFF